ncbi:hypothetical protein BGZ95_001576 [Linnemannia exigua]|uniref:F-box domain-containing protein n=1 Tax=Linnemannia exigua TaxID=604196 RepID=A0AAD4DL22_9FUNG|nr:hypothetical protein BGZ95_001576 [Linnemannia exigua]
MPSSDARNKFFEVPELFERLCSFLEAHDLAQLLQTSRDNYTATTPHFWRHVDLEDDRRVDRLITTPAAVDALAKNLPFVHTLRAGFIFMSYYFEGVMAYLDEQEQDTTSTVRIDRPPWLPQAIKKSPPAPALPPMTRLTQLDVFFDRQYRGILFENAMRLNKPVRLLRPLAWLMSLNTTGLKHVYFSYMDLPEPLELRCLARSLSRLTNLTHLRIEMWPACWFSAPMIPILFFACPQSIVSFKLEAFMNFSHDDDGADERRMRTVQAERDENDDWEEGDVMAREGSLRNMKELVLPSMRMGYSSGLIRRIMRCCPALESWDIPCLRDNHAAQELFTTIRERVCRLRHLTAMDPWHDSRGERWIGVMSTLPEQQLQSVDFVKYQGADGFLPAILRHSETLRSIIIREALIVRSTTLATILQQCRGLETFWVTGDFGSLIAVELEEAIGAEWVCNGLRDLRITVDLNGKGSEDVHGSRDGGCGGIPTELEMDCRLQSSRKHWTTLEAFYTQLGKLIQLETLELFVWTRHDACYTNQSFTGLLSLKEEDMKTGKKGFLSLLKGLKKLRVIQGCFQARTMEAMETFGQREVEWIVDNWPALEMIELLPKRYKLVAGFEIPEHVQWLHEKKPKLNLAR